MPSDDRLWSGLELVMAGLLRGRRQNRQKKNENSHRAHYHAAQGAGRLPGSRPDLVLDLY